ncbi:MAG: tRNA (guanosine(37)-N1)-methyltransferase TrmD [Candidatus Comchoanobacterales bacterium]
MLTFDIISCNTSIQHFFQQGLIHRAIQKKRAKIQCWNPRIFANTHYQNIDDKTFGGGPGQVIRADILDRTLNSIPKRGTRCKTILLSPSGPTLTHAKAIELTKLDQIILICGRYEGIDQRFIQLKVDESLSIGDYVLTGGELPALVTCEAVIRLLPGTVGNLESVNQDSFANGLLDHPHYTKPEDFLGHNVPTVLRSGNHQAIKAWRRMMALGQTWLERPDLLVGQSLSSVDISLLSHFMARQTERSNDDKFNTEN